MADDKPAQKIGLDLLLFFIIVGSLFTLWVQNGGPTRAEKEGLIKNDVETSSSQDSISDSDSGSSDKSSISSPENVEDRHSPYYGQIKIQASSIKTTSPNSEYITLVFRGNDKPINIGGWTLKNGRDQKYYNVAGREVKGQSVLVKIPFTGIASYNPYRPETNVPGPITLKSGEKAVIVTGQVPSLADFTINDNFKINRCLGYLEDKTQYRFNPTLRYRCPASKEFSGVDGLSEECAKFARSIGSCHEPEEIYKQEKGYCLDNNCTLNSFCQGFIKQTFNFQSCFTNFSHDEDFIGPDWRIFLKRNWELWESTREIITLYDASGLLVDQLKIK